MIVVKGVEWKGTPNVGCNNGITDEVVVTLAHGKILFLTTLTTCRCGKGCHGLDRVPSVGDSFENMDEFWEYTDS